MSQIAIYARVSTNYQEKSQTIASQLELLKQYVKAKGEELSEEQIFIDNGVSGAQLERPALDRLRDRVSWGEINHIVIVSADRLARSYPHQWLLLEEFSKYRCQVDFLENPYGDSPQGHLLAQMQGMIAEYERSQIMERTRRGRLHKARKGAFMPWLSQTYGYRYSPKQGHLPPSVAVDPEQAAVIRQMFNWLITEQLSTRQIVKRLNTLKIPTRTQNNSVWHPSSVRHILRNQIYTGKGYYNKTKREILNKVSQSPLMVHRSVELRVQRPKEEWVAITAPAIIDEQTFQKAQYQLKLNEKNAFRCYRPDSHRYLLRTLVSCAECGLSMTALRQKSGQKEYFYYQCTGKNPLTVGRKKRCLSKRVHSQALDNVVWKSIQSLIEKPQSIQKEYQLWQKAQYHQKDAFEEQLQSIQKSVKQLRQQEKRLIDAYQEAIITLEDLSIRKKQIHERLEALAQQQKQLILEQKATIKWDILIENIEQFKQIIAKNLNQLPFIERQAICRLLIEKVIVYPDGKIDIYHILPFEEKPIENNQKKKVLHNNFYLLRLSHVTI